MSFFKRSYFGRQFFDKFFGPSAAMAGATADFSYSVRNTVGKTATLAWDVQELPVPVKVPISPLFGDWRVHAPLPQPVGKTAILAWNVGAAVAADARLEWQVRATVGVSANIAWQVRGTVKGQADFQWQVRSRVGADLPVAWRVRGLAGRTADMGWQQRSLVAATRAIAYEVRPFDPFERNLHILMTEIDEDADLVLDSWRKAA